MPCLAAQGVAGGGSELIRRRGWRGGRADEDVAGMSDPLNTAWREGLGFDLPTSPRCEVGPSDTNIPSCCRFDATALPAALQAAG